MRGVHREREERKGEKRREKRGRGKRERKEGEKRGREKSERKEEGKKEEVPRNLRKPQISRNSRISHSFGRNSVIFTPRVGEKEGEKRGREKREREKRERKEGEKRGREKRGREKRERKEEEKKSTSQFRQTANFAYSRISHSFGRNSVIFTPRVRNSMGISACSKEEAKE
jgi:hypothetical protein